VRDFHWVEHEELDHLCGVFDSWALDDRQSRARIHMTEQFARLLTKQEHLIELNDSIGPRRGWKGPAPTATQQQRLFEATQDRFQTYYATLSSIVAFLNRLPEFTAKYGHPSHNSTAKAIAWMRTLTTLPFLEQTTDCGKGIPCRPRSSGWYSALRLEHVEGGTSRRSDAHLVW
jgi:hypothetical protein